MKIEKRKPLFVFISVIRALFLRELDMRLSQGKSGVMWTFLEPFLQVFIFIYIRVIIKEHSDSATISSYNYTVFMASGFIIFNLFRRILTSSIGAFSANKALFSYKQVKPIDTIISRVFVEVFLTSCIIVIFLFIGFLFDIENFIPKNILMVFISIVWFILFSLGFGLLIGIGNFFYMSIGKFMNVISFLLLIFSAVFFSISSLPPMVQELLLYSPLVHFMEMLHGFYLYGLDDRYVDYIYVIYWTIVPYIVSLWLYIRLEKRIISQ